MDTYKVEDVFKTEGLPELTFVEPLNYGELFVDFRNTTKPVIIEGPSGSGKTVTAKKLMNTFYSGSNVLEFSGRLSEHHSQLKRAIVTPSDAQVLFIDDFHRFPQELQQQVGDKVKLISEGAISEKTKYIVSI